MKASKVNVYQKLVIVKDLYTEKKSQYILTLIPTPSYEARYGSSTVGNFVNCGEKQGYCGLAIYTCVYSPFTVRVSRYQTGNRVEGTFLFSPETRNVQSNKAELARALTSSVIVQRRKVTVTRSEDFSWDIDGGWLDEVVITPDDGDDDMEKWLEQWRKETRPEIVDPEPEEEIPEEPYDEGAQSDNSKDDGQKDDDKDFDSEISKVKNELKKMGVNFSGIKIEEGDCGDRSGTNAFKGEGGIIYICSDMFEYDIKTQAAILWHEIYHIRNDQPVSDKPEFLSTTIRMTPPPDIDAIIWEKSWDGASNEYEAENNYNAFVSFTVAFDLTYLQNELNCYNAERNLFPDSVVDVEYAKGRAMTIWITEMQIEISKEYYK